jgi:hypothetical protein
VQAESLTLSLGTIATTVTPIVAAGVWVVKWIVARSDKDRDELLRRMDLERAASAEDRAILQDTLHALKNAVQVASGDGELVVQRLAELTASQQRIVWAQERILAIIDARQAKEANKQP